MKERIESLRNLVCIVIRAWQDFLDSLNTDGGHIMLLAVLFMSTLAIGIHWKLEKAESVVLQVFTALMVLLKTAGSNKTRRDRPEPPDIEKTVKSETSIVETPKSETHDSSKTEDKKE